MFEHGIMKTNKGSVKELVDGVFLKSIPSNRLRSQYNVPLSVGTEQGGFGIQILKKFK